jgi:hypothetical protein
VASSKTSRQYRKPLGLIIDHIGMGTGADGWNKMTANPPPSNRRFGIVFLVFFALLGAYHWWHNNRVYPYLFGLALLMGAAALLKPSLLAPYNRAWLRFSEILHRVVSPIVLGIMFFGVITPFGIVMRALRNRDIMRRTYDPNASSYWIKREPPGPSPDSFSNQF